jgi:hypothetical protein
VPDARFCGACGAHLSSDHDRAARRVQSYAPFPHEPVLRLSIITSLFPHLSHRAKTPFRAGFAIFVALLVAFALGGATAPLIALSVLGVPLLFILYIVEVDPYEDSFIPPTIACLLIGGGLGAGWAVIGGSYVDKALLPSLTPSLTSASSIAAAVGVPAIGQLLMCVPMVVARRMQTGRIEALDGFVAGATGALGFTLASTIDLMAPWLSNGELTHQSFLANITQVVLRGVTFPLISALATGFVGAAYWAELGGASTAAKGRWIASPVVAFGLAVLVQVGLGFTDIAALSDAVLLGVHLAALGLMVLAMRVGIHHVLLHEARDVTIGPPRVCANCGHLVPVMPFCPQCGVADRALPRPARVWRGPSPVEPADQPSGESWVPGVSGGAALPAVAWPTAAPGTADLKLGFPEARQLRSPPHRVTHAAMLVLFSAGLGLLTLMLVVVAVLATPGPPAKCPALLCQGPPIRHPGTDSPAQGAGPAVRSGTPYENPQGYSLSYPPGASVTRNASGIGLTYNFVHGGTAYFDVIGGPAGGATAQSAVDNVIAQNFPQATEAYQLPDPLIGYEPAYGLALNVEPASSYGSTAMDRVIVDASVVNSFGILVLTYGSLLPNVTPSSEFFDGHPSPANLNMAYLGGDEIVDSIHFPR